MLMVHTSTCIVQYRLCGESLGEVFHTELSGDPSFDILSAELIIFQDDSDSSLDYLFGCREKSCSLQKSRVPEPFCLSRFDGSFPRANLIRSTEYQKS